MDGRAHFVIKTFPSKSADKAAAPQSPPSECNSQSAQDPNPSRQERFDLIPDTGGFYLNDMLHRMPQRHQTVILGNRKQIGTKGEMPSRVAWQR